MSESTLLKKFSIFLLSIVILGAAVLCSCFYKIGILLLGIFTIIIFVYLIYREKSIDRIIYCMIALYPLNNIFVLHLFIIDIRVIQLLFILLFIKFIILKAQGKTVKFDKLKINKYILFFMISVLISTVFSESIKISFKEFVQYVYLFVMFNLVESKINNIENFKGICRGIIMSNIIFLVGIFISVPQIKISVLPGMSIEREGELFSPILLAKGGERLSIFSMGYVETACFCMILIYCCITVKEVLKDKKIICDILILLDLFMIVLTASRAAWVILLFSFIIYRNYKKSSKLLTVLLLIVICCVALSIPSIYDRVMNIISFKESSNKDHLVLWIIAIRIGLDNFLLGIGPGMFINSVQDYKYIIRSMGAYTQSMDTHNMFLQAFSEQGILGVISIFILIAYILYTQNKRVKSIVKKRKIKICLLVSVMCISLMSMTMNGFKGELYWILVALLISSDKFLEYKNIEKDCKI